MLRLLLTAGVALAHPPVPKSNPRRFLNEQGVFYNDHGLWALVVPKEATPLNKMALDLKERTGQDLIITFDPNVMGFNNAVVISLHKNAAVQMLRLTQFGAPVTWEQFEGVACQKLINKEGD